MPSLRTLLPLAAALGVLAIATPDAQAQVRFTTDKKSSLVWWQINPHMNHLWATTCPAEPSWRPGEGRSAGWVITRAFRPPKQGEADVSDTTIIPLYPRRRVRSVCAEAVDARVTVADTAKWTGVRGEVTVQSDAFIGGYDVRDAFVKEKLFQSMLHPEIKMTIDSLVDVTQHGDTLRGTVYGMFTLRAVTQPVHASMKFWPELGGLRVLGKVKINALDLIPVYGMSGLALGMGVGTRIWHDVYFGVDLLLRTSETSSSH